MFEKYKWFISDTEVYSEMDVKQMPIKVFQDIIESYLQLYEDEKQTFSVINAVLTTDLHYIIFKHNRADIIQWLYSKSLLKGKKDLWTKYAVIYGHKKILRWLKELNLLVTYNSITYAIESNNVKSFVWLLGNGATFNTYTDRKLIVKSGLLNMLKWVHELKLNWDIVDSRKIALENDHQHIVEWIDSLE